MKNLIFVGVLCGLLQACTVGLRIDNYKFEDKFFTPFDVRGSVVVTNGQPSADELIVYSESGVKIASDLKTLTEVMVRQTAEQAKLRGTVKDVAGSKSIELKILTIKSTYAFFHANSKMLYQVKLGSGEAFNKTVEHTSGDPHQDITGCVADGVIALFQDAKVKAYLAQ